MRLYIILLCILSALIIVSIHELGHYVAARFLNLHIEKVGFSMKPIPRLYVSIIDNKIRLKNRIIFYLSGSMTVIIVFIIVVIAKIEIIYLYYIIAAQIIIDTNPIFSDYVMAISSWKYRKDIRRLFFQKESPDISELIVNRVKNEYFFSVIWYIHLVLWGTLIVFLLFDRIGIYRVR